MSITPPAPAEAGDELRIDGRAAWRGADTATGNGVLTGLRVLDLSRVLAGPYTAQMLADQGAEVIKVEAPAGDETRGWGPPFVDSGTSAYYGSLNHSKDNICLDLRTTEGREILGHLIAGADVIIENFKAGTMARWGFDFDTVLSRLYPRLIYCRITGFGVDGPMGGLPGYDAVLQSFGGLMSINGYPDGNPLRVGVPIVDIVTANLAVNGILLSLLERDRSGHGQLVDMALLDAVISLLHPHAANWIASGSVPQRTGDFHPTVVPYQVFRAADGDFFVSAANDRQFRSLTKTLGVPELADEPRFASNAQRHAHREELVALLGELIAAWPRAELAARLEEAGVAASSVNTVDEALQSAQARHRELFIEAPDYRGVGVPISLSRSPHRRPRPAVARGADTASVLTAMGYPADRIGAWRSAGIFGDP
ncbi:carnitine dehydratase [Nocardia sp. 852002-20019_SCH5090214]|uniref:CoA transferase n=1 Tax=Nocardia nova TaxID=37330 RepID=A0A2S6A5U8_9NOCA|nr:MULTISPECIES: CoA transferase [Nocardia]OBF66888.1 carnitine dehydratase [Mycobacterium sp. 852002-51759_SCH5129042]MBF6277977.1 CoA transferase [Nocardia nova]OBA55461.1 carnitine dehydratase [Nocardia sp. 852002-51101_SCH5132738]OBA66451.1 carnitine dehydratase [Nocardia sp. 852002-20019_SCH5090214]OBB49728.1 carnitine dehydratase [Nocardia sp. 852002-51244_SCH5132740]